MGKFDRLLAREFVAIERQQASRSILIDRRLHPRGVPQLGTDNSSASVFNALAESDQPGEHSSDRLAIIGCCDRIQLLSSPGDGPAHPTHVLVCRHCHHPRLRPFEEFREGVLQQRKSAGVVVYIGDDPGNQARLELDPNLPRRLSDGQIDLRGGERRHRHHGAFEQRGKPGVL